MKRKVLSFFLFVLFTTAAQAQSKELYFLENFFKDHANPYTPVIVTQKSLITQQITSLGGFGGNNETQLIGVPWSNIKSVKLDDSSVGIDGVNYMIVVTGTIYVYEKCSSNDPYAEITDGNNNHYRASSKTVDNFFISLTEHNGQRVTEKMAKDAVKAIKKLG